MKKYKPYIVGAVGGVMAAALVPLSGLVSFDASSGPNAVSDWFFTVAARQAVTLRSFDLPVPELDNPAAIQRGAGHYELVCAACHGSPSGTPEAFADDLVPVPPRLVEQMSNWRPDARVFWTVKHGIKRSAMPAWPSQMRDDEVWDMVAFLQAMPNLSPAEYDGLAGTALGGCASCHGETGEGNGAVPRLDIQSPEYLRSALESYRSGIRPSGTMIAAARRMSDDEIAAFADFFGQSVQVETDASEGLGAEIAARGLPDRPIAACDSCHGPTARASFPRLMGQNREYLVTQLELFNAHGSQRGGAFAELMAQAIRFIPAVESGALSAEEIEALADHYGR